MTASGVSHYIASLAEKASAHLKIGEVAEYAEKGTQSTTSMS